MEKNISKVQSEEQPIKIEKPEGPGSSLSVERIYLKEFSLEQPNSPGILLERDTPNLDIQVNVSVQRLSDHVFEVTILGTITSSLKEKVVYLAEAKQAGIFSLNNLAEDKITKTLEIDCPNIIYPYLRANLADIITRAGFFPVNLDPIDFAMLHEKRAISIKKSAESQNQTKSTGSFEDSGSKTIH